MARRPKGKERAVLCTLFLSLNIYKELPGDADSDG